MTTFKKITGHNQKGIALLLSLLLMAALTAAGISASSVIINEFRTTASTDAGIGAYYAADVGIERSLFTIFNSRLSNLPFGEITYPSGTPYVVPHVLFNDPPMAPLIDGATVALSDTAITQNSKVVNIQKDQSVQLDLFSQTSQFNPSAAIGVARKLILRSPNLTALSPTAWVEVQWTYVRRTASNANPAPNATIRLVAAQNLNLSGDGTCAGVEIDLLTGSVLANGTACPVAIVNPAGLTTNESTPGENELAGWNVRIKALYADLPNLMIETKKSDNSTYPIPGDFNLVSRGQSGSARARLDANVPWKLPSSGLFDYVIFSETDLDKPGS